MKQKLKFQYFYKNNRCNADKSTDPDCICWHDEGEGPFQQERHNDEVPKVEWRIKPNE